MTTVLQIVCLVLFLIGFVLGGVAFWQEEYLRAIAAFVGAIVAYHAYGLCGSGPVIRSST